MDVNQIIDDLLAEAPNKKPSSKVFSTTTISNRLKGKLFAYQEPHVIKLVNILLKYNVALDNSDTGIGKTYAACGIALELGRHPVVICTKTTMPSWANVLDYIGVRYYDIVNYETARQGKTYKNDNYTSRKKSPYLDLVEIDPKEEIKSPYMWDLPKDAILIIDEVHKCKSTKTEIGKLLMSAKQLIHSKIPVLLLSATICEKKQDIKIPYYLFGLIEHPRGYNRYMQCVIKNNRYPQHRITKETLRELRDNPAKLEEEKNNKAALIIFEEIKEYTARIKIKDLGDKFPSNQWCAQQFVAQEANEIAAAYEEIAELKRKLEENPGSNHLARIQKLKQEIELRKIPIFEDQAIDYLENGKSVIIFVNYLDTLRILSEHLEIHCQIHGSQTPAERQEAINLFQSNQERIIICQIRAGGIGISLHDLHGDHPRVTLINYPDQASDLLQALGRAHRSGGKSPVLQRIIFVANVDYEKRIMRNINRKLQNISGINDGDLTCHKYKVKKITKKKVQEI